MDLSKSLPLLGISFPIHKVGTLHELTTYDSLLFYEKNHNFSPISSDKGEERKEGGRREVMEGGGQILFTVCVCIRLD